MISPGEANFSGSSKMELMDLQTEEVVKRSTLQKYKILCAVSIALCLKKQRSRLKLITYAAKVHDI